MTYSLINREFYDAIINFERSEKAQDYYYKVMDTVVEREGVRDTIRNRILRVYAMLFCEDVGLEPGEKAGTVHVANTADRLYIGDAGYDPDHWYRMKHHFPEIDDDNYDRFAALVISDMNSGPLHDAALNDGEVLLVGEPDPLHMTAAQRRNQQLREVTLPAGGEN